ncbi:hypothetical protein [Actinoplanes sp. NPDC026623]|uniref:hypothetical protein n=1 Tax=Actinoplanes sp. NPDC026623 TaxID=3155610 RepID=UPI00340CAFD4
MSIPSVPGFIDPLQGNTLADVWTRPDGNYPEELWPVDDLRTVTRNPNGWLVIDEHFFTNEKHGGRGCVLVDADDAAIALQGTSWIGRDLGRTAVWDDGGFESGLTSSEREANLAFFGQARRASGSSMPTVEITFPFLWYWDAFPVSNGYRYLNEAGREQDLVRWECTADSWKVEVRALELRQFLAACGKAAVIQVDIVPKVASPKFDRVDSSFSDVWAHFDIHILHQTAMGDRPAYSRLLGQYLITGLRNSRAPRFESRGKDREYPTFIYGLDSETGEPLTHTCDPDQLGTYFDKDGTRLHYLTPVYFKREVLQPYAAEPGRYRLSPARLSCLDLWGIDISFNSAGLVEVYLGDLGRDLPSDEWGHWRTYNVPPEGTMDEGRFRRDFLAQWASSKDVVGDLRRARQRAADASAELLGAPIWKPLADDVQAEFESLIGPLTDDPSALGQPLLLLTKVLADGIDPAPLKAHLSTYEKGEQSLRLLQRYTQQLGDESDVTAILRDLQGFRSRGGIAHLAGSGKAKAAAALEITDLSNVEAFESVVARATACLEAITSLIRDQLAKGSKANSD